jgi:hypothetical protein
LSRFHDHVPGRREPAAIDAYILARDMARGCRGQQGDYIGDVFRFADEPGGHRPGGELVTET